MSTVPSESSFPLGAKRPKYCRKRCKGRPDRAYVRIDGKKITLGAFTAPDQAAWRTDLQPNSAATDFSFRFPFRP
jgi:hypothetical protein